MVYLFYRRGRLPAGYVKHFKDRRTSSMCGIAGVYAPGGRLTAEAVRVMLDSMRRRGPDDRGAQVLADGAVVFGHLRLSILDLSPLGHQPMSSPDGSTWVVYNGEIYNFKEIRATLESFGCRFRSDSDTEVILAAYEKWGLEAVERFRGMFAFALWDARRNQLHLCRDRFGVKPLYYCRRDGLLSFASEVKALNCAGYTARMVDQSSVAEFVQYGYISAPKSIFADVQTLRPGHICTFDEKLNVCETTYWRAADLFEGPASTALRAELETLGEEQLLDRVELALQQAFEYRMVADVPVGLFLSGGIDSSLVATLLARRSGFRLTTFTIGYDDSEFDETLYARKVAETLGANHVELKVSPKEALDLAAETPEIADEPIGDSSLVPTLMVSKLARRHVKVALSADGADELFGGYARYAYCSDFLKQRSRALGGLYHLSAEVLDRLPPGLVAAAYRMARGSGPKFAGIEDKLRKFVRMARASNEFEAYDGAVSEWSAAQSAGLMRFPQPDFGAAREAFRAIGGADVRERFMHFDAVRYLPGDLLVKVDRASMYVSLEAREPFLDHEAARLAAALPMTWKIRGRQNKYILRRLLARYFPSELFDRPKQGFSAPVAQWLRGPLRPLLLDALSPARVRQVGLLDPQAVSSALENFLGSKSRQTSAASLWILLQLQLWADRWMHEPSRSLGQVAAC